MKSRGITGSSTTTGTKEELLVFKELFTTLRKNRST
jgi:hypothetical protein